MSNWLTFPSSGWSAIGRTISGFGSGEGSYGLAYAVDSDSGAVLNGRVSAHIRLARDRPVNGAGVICRSNPLRSFVAFYVLTDESSPTSYSVRLAAFKYGKLMSLVGLKERVYCPSGQFEMALQFFSGEMVGELECDGATARIDFVMPELPFAGHAGVVRFYNSSALASNFHVERITMKPVLPEQDQNELDGIVFPYSVFLSHSSADRATVERVVDALKDAGISYWIDSEQITFGDPIVSKIEDGLKGSRYVVVCLSKNLANSGWCRAEYAPILYREFSGDTKRRVIPLSLDGSTTMESTPLLLSDKMKADFENAASFSAFIEFLRQPVS